VKGPGSANHAYYLWVDRFNTLGLGPNVPIASTNGGESLLAIVDGKPVDLRVPYPQGFFTKNVDGRIDDPNGGWKGRGLWTTSGTRTVFHSENGTKDALRGSSAKARPHATPSPRRGEGWGEGVRDLTIFGREPPHPDRFAT
jgi:hypothetical protein